MNQDPHVPPQDWTGGPGQDSAQGRAGRPEGAPRMVEPYAEWANGPDPKPTELEAQLLETNPLAVGTKLHIAFERERAWEEAPLSLTAAQKSRLWRILSQELGNILAFRILTRIESEA